MLVPRPHLLPPLLLLTSTLAVAACDFDIPPAHEYVVSRISVPATSPEAQAFGMDLDGDGSVDNRLGAILAILAGQGVELQTAVSGAIDRGTIILLVNFRTASFSSTRDARAEVRLGDSASATPAPCAGTADAVCRKHLDGTGDFTVAPDSPADAALTGKIVDGTFQGGPGEVSFEISFGGSAPVPIHLLGARAKATGIDAAGIDSIIVAGGLTMDSFEANVVPALRDRIGELVRVSCPGTAPPDCGCTAGISTSRTLLTVFDTAPKDCGVSTQEISNNFLVRTVFGADVTIDGKPCLSVGLKAQAVPASF